MRHWITVTILIGILGAASACGDDPPTPTAPTTTPTIPTTPTTTTPAAPTVESLALRAPSWFVDSYELEIGETVQVTAHAEYSDGSTEVVTDEATWVSSNDHVAMVVNGLITGRNLGGANVRATFEDITVATPGFRVIRGAYVSVRNVRMEESSRSYYRVKGTVINSGSEDFTGFLEMYARFYDSSGLLLSDDRDYIETGGTFAVDQQRTFDILVSKSDISGWSYYTLAFLDGNDQEVACGGCDEQRR